MKPALRITRLIALLAFAIVAGTAYSQSFPHKPIRFVTGNAPGGGTDTITRMITPKLSELLGQTIIVDNKPGANGIIASEYVAKSEPDGYTLLVGTDGQMVLNVGLYKTLPYDPVADFAPVSELTSTPVMMVVHPSLPARSIKELIELAKAKPGKLFYASGAPVFQVTTEMFKSRTGVDIVHVPFKGTAPAITATIAGDTGIATVSVGPVLPQLRAGKLRGLAVTTSERIELLPDTPTLAESGLPGFHVAPWTGLFAPAATPRAVVDKLSREVNAALRTDEVKKLLGSRGFIPRGTTPEQMAALLKSDLAKWPKAMKDANIQPQ